MTSPLLGQRIASAAESLIIDFTLTLVHTSGVGDAYVTLLHPFIEWAWHVQKLPLRRSVILDPHVIDYYIHARKPIPPEYTRKALRFISERSAEPVPSETTTTSAPYGALDIVRLISWARSQTTEGRRDNANLLLALGLGAGLTAREIITTRVEDIRRSDTAVEVVVRERHPRVVPMLADYVPLLPDFPSGPKRFAFRQGRIGATRSTVAKFIQRGDTGTLTPVSKRLRNTWIVHHLETNTPIAKLISTAGVQSPRSLDRYQAWVGAEPPAPAPIRADDRGRPSARCDPV